MGDQSRMKKFDGFSEQETFSQVPDVFFRRLLPEIDDLDELKVSLYALWRFEHMEGRIRLLRTGDFSSLVADPHAALEKAVSRGMLLSIGEGKDRRWVLNSPRGRSVAEVAARGLLDAADLEAGTNPPLDRPNIFKLYEENIGALTPLMADALKDAEQTYPADWVAEALEIAVKSNKRSWSYIEAILRRWKEEGHAKEQDGRDNKEHRGRDVERKVDEFFKR